MLSIKTITYTSELSTDELVQKLSWTVEKIDSLFKPLFLNRSCETNKDWIGYIIKPSNKFTLMEPLGILSLIIMQVIIRGNIEHKENKTHVNIQFRLGWHTLLSSSMVYLMSALIIASHISESQYWSALFTLILPLVWSYLLIRKTKRMESKLDKIFE